MVSPILQELMILTTNQNKTGCSWDIQYVANNGDWILGKSRCSIRKGVPIFDYRYTLLVLSMVLPIGIIGWSTPVPLFLRCSMSYTIPAHIQSVGKENSHCAFTMHNLTVGENDASIFSASRTRFLQLFVYIFQQCTQQTAVSSAVPFVLSRFLITRFTRMSTMLPLPFLVLW